MSPQRILELKSDIAEMRSKGAPRCAAKVEECIIEIERCHKILKNRDKRKSRSIDKPWIKEAITYGVSDLGLSTRECEEFYDYQESIGWVYGKSLKPIVDWKAAMRTFARNKEKWSKDSDTYKARPKAPHAC